MKKHYSQPYKFPSVECSLTFWIRRFSSELPRIPSYGSGWRMITTMMMMMMMIGTEAKSLHGWTSVYLEQTASPSTSGRALKMAMDGSNSVSKKPMTTTTRQILLPLPWPSTVRSPPTTLRSSLVPVDTTVSSSSSYKQWHQPHYFGYHSLAMKFACSMGFSTMADQMVWPPSLSRDRKWTRVTKCTHSQPVIR